MIIEKLPRNEWGWQTIFKYRKSTNDIVMEYKSNTYPNNNRDFSLDKEEIKALLKFIKKNKLFQNESNL